MHWWRRFVILTLDSRKANRQRCALWHGSPGGWESCFCRSALTFPGFVHWWRKSADNALRYTLAGDSDISTWLQQYCVTQSWQLQQAKWEQGLNLLAWHEGKLMLGLWSAATLPQIDDAAILSAFVQTPENAQTRHALLGGNPVVLRLIRARLFVVVLT